MANITRIKAKDPSRPNDAPEKKPATTDKETKKLEKIGEKARKKAEKKQKKADKKPFILFRPFIALGRYLKGSCLELRQVRWPNRKATWKMVLVVIVYTLLFSGFLVALDILFDFIFKHLLA